jgi:multidrug resistance efflux pump
VRVLGEIRSNPISTPPWRRGGEVATLALIESDSYRVEGYFEETKIPHIRPGGIAEIYLMDGSPALQGTVASIARGITDQDNKDGPQLQRTHDGCRTRSVL